MSWGWTVADEPRDEWSRSVVRVGDGRGFVIETVRGDHFVITAGHCLPNLPPSHAASRTDERTYARLLGPLGAVATVSTECAFVDPVADLALLSSPDNQAFCEEAADYDALTEAIRPLPIGSLTHVRKRITIPNSRRSMLGPPKAESDAWLLSLGGRWFSCRVRSAGRAIWVEEPAEPIQSGMSGSPIVVPGGFAVGIISTGGGPNPEVAADLPGWILRDTGVLKRR